MKLCICKKAMARIKGDGAIFLALMLLAFIISLSHPADIITSLSNIGARPNIVLDAGHGGFDGGASSKSGVPEKDINLSIALKTRDILNFLGYEVVMTRSEDKALADSKKEDMYRRLEIANDTPNALFLSIHQNYFSQEKYSGAQIFYGSNNEGDAKSLALILQENFRENINPQNNRQAKTADKSLFLFKKAPQPSVLIECGFLSNYNEAQLLQNQKYQTKIALTIAQSILEYYKLSDVERSF